MQDPYCYPNSRILKNKLGIKDANKLQQRERDLSNLRALELLNDPIIGCFDFKHFQMIHKHLFQDIYDWAGEVRTVDIAKGNLFCRCFAIESEASRIFTELKSEKFLKDMPINQLAERLAYYLAEINALHPFREGNGRTQREFIRQLAYQNNLFLSYAGITQYEMISASKASFNLNYKPLQELILSHLHPLF